LKYRKWKGKINIKEYTEKCELGLKFDGHFFAVRRPDKCPRYENGDNQYKMPAGKSGG